MFDIGFTELIVIGVVALIVIGPERLPKVARTAGHLYGRLQRYVSSVKSDISQEIQLDEIRRAGQEFKDSIESAVAGAEQQATVVDDYLRNEVAEAERVITLPERDHPVPPAAKKPPVADQKPTEQSPQQSLLLDEPDQNTHVRVPAAEQAGASGDNPDKSA